MNKRLNEDINLAKQVINEKKENSRFCDISGIYRGTTEFNSALPYQNAIKNRERILSVIASGDQIINSILLGSKDIECIDISRFPKYYLMLKFAAIKSLSKKQYLDFFFDGICSNSLSGKLYLKFNYNKKSSQVFSERLYSKLYSNLDKEAQVFWDSLFDCFNPCELVNSRLFIKLGDHLTSKDTICYKNPYLDGDNYRKLKNLLDGITINFYQGDVFELMNANMKEFDLVNLSNIIEWNAEEDQKLEKYKELVESIPLTDDGIVLSYLDTYYKFWDHSGRLNRFDENYQKISFEIENPDADGLLLYRKR